MRKGAGGEDGDTVFCWGGDFNRILLLNLKTVVSVKHTHYVEDTRVTSVWKSGTKIGRPCTVGRGLGGWGVVFPLR